MPTDINVADGKLANWHRFDALDRAVVKDAHVMMSLADSTGNAKEQIQAIWTKLGGLHTPPRVVYFTREDLGKNEAAQAPGQYPNISGAFSTPNGVGYIVFLVPVNLNFDLGGAAPTYLDVRMTQGVSTNTKSHDMSTYPYGGIQWVFYYDGGQLYASTLDQTVLANSGNWNLDMRIRSPFGDGAWSNPITVSTTL